MTRAWELGRREEIIISHAAPAALVHRIVTIAHRKAAKKICEFLTRHKAFVAFSVDDRARSGGKEVLKAAEDKISAVAYSSRLPTLGSS